MVGGGRAMSVMRRTATALAALAWACGTSTGPDDAAARLVGVWVWVESTGGIAGTTVTPDDAGYEMRLEFGADGTVRLTRDGQEDATTTYRVDPSPGDDTVRVVYTEPVLGVATQEVRFEGDDTLLLVDPCCDGFTYRFRRAGS